MPPARPLAPSWLTWQMLCVSLQAHVRPHADPMDHLTTLLWAPGVRRWRKLWIRIWIGRAKSREPGCRNAGKPRIRQARRQAARPLPIPDLPGTSPNVPGSFDKAKSFRDNGARTRLRPRARGCDSSLLAPWKAHDPDQYRPRVLPVERPLEGLRASGDTGCSGRSSRP